MVEENKYSDLLVVCGNDQYPCHRAVVCMRSTYFRSRCKEVENEWNFVRDPSSVVILVVTSDLVTQQFPIIDLGLDGEYTHVIAAVMTYLYTLDYAQSNQSLTFRLPQEMQNMWLTEGEDKRKDSELDAASSTYDLLEDTMEDDVQIVPAEEQTESQGKSLRSVDDQSGARDPGLWPVELVFHAQVYCASVVLGIPCLAKLAQQKFLRRLYNSKVSNHELLMTVLKVYRPSNGFEPLCRTTWMVHEELKPHFQTMCIELVRVLYKRWSQIKGDSHLEAAVIECPEFGKDLLRLL